jgi:hypothetical protein
VQLDDFESASLRIDDVIASGTWVLIKRPDCRNLSTASAASHSML